MTYNITTKIDEIESAQNYFITHYTSLYPFYCSQPSAFKREVFVLYTHDYFENVSERNRSISCLKECKIIFV